MKLTHLLIFLTRRKGLCINPRDHTRDYLMLRLLRAVISFLGCPPVTLGYHPGWLFYCIPGLLSFQVSRSLFSGSCAVLLERESSHLFLNWFTWDQRFPGLKAENVCISPSHEWDVGLGFKLWTHEFWIFPHSLEDIYPLSSGWSLLISKTPNFNFCTLCHGTFLCLSLLPSSLGF